MFASDDQQIGQLESSFPATAGNAFSKAYDEAINAGLSVVASDNGSLFEVFPDGRRRFLKDIDPPVAAEPGQKLILERHNQ
jgi:hypothetical protein